jgi:hypothetical protein
MVEDAAKPVLFNIAEMFPSATPQPLLTLLRANSNMAAEPRHEAIIVKASRGKLQDRLSGVLLRRRETTAVRFKKQDACNEAGSLVAVDKRMIPYNAYGVSRRHLDHSRRFGVRIQLTRARQCRLEQPLVTQTRRTTKMRQ